MINSDHDVIPITLSMFLLHSLYIAKPWRTTLDLEFGDQIDRRHLVYCAERGAVGRQRMERKTHDL